MHKKLLEPSVVNPHQSHTSKLNLLASEVNPGHYCMDVKMSRGNVIPSLNGSQLYSSHPKQKCTKIYPEETTPGPRPLPYMGKILTFDRKVVEDPFFYQNDRI